jgi:hypothetical protein
MDHSRNGWPFWIRTNIWSPWKPTTRETILDIQFWMTWTDRKCLFWNSCQAVPSRILIWLSKYRRGNYLCSLWWLQMMIQYLRKNAHIYMFLCFSPTELWRINQHVLILQKASIYKRDYVIVTWLGHFFERLCQLMT